MLIGAGAAVATTLVAALTSTVDEIDWASATILAGFAAFAVVMAPLRLEAAVATLLVAPLVAASTSPQEAIAVSWTAAVVTWLHPSTRSLALTALAAIAAAALTAIAVDAANVGGPGRFVTLAAIVVFAAYAVESLITTSASAKVRVLAALATSACVVGAAIGEDFAGDAGLAMVLALVLAGAYLLRMLDRARSEASAYAELSWSVLAEMLGMMAARDIAAARHAAATARYARAIAAQAGMDDADQELAHTAGLLHDIGSFVFDDAVLRRSGTLADEDWSAIRKHPKVGERLLGRLDLYGPVARIVGAHHERPDARGYPDGLADEEIPALAKVVAVAEIYDTLTAPDSYRGGQTSFKALTELRRVAGRQLDGQYVEALAQALAGQNLDFRHGTDARVDAELELERQIADQAALAGLPSLRAAEPIPPPELLSGR